MRLKKSLAMFCAGAIMMTFMPLSFIRDTAVLAAGYFGECGYDINWKYDSTTQILTISGTGEMETYDYGHLPPWNEYSTAIKQIIIEDGVTTISDFAFGDCTNVEKITLPDGLSEIGNTAFARCSFSEIKLPDSLSSIGATAFESCSALTSVNIPDNVTCIPYGAFSNCSSLTSVKISNNAASIESYAFSGCLQLESVVIPESVKTIEKNAFVSCIAMTSITILNPDCEIFDSNDTICGSWVSGTPNYAGIIYGYEDSTAQAYAEKYGYQFSSLGEAVPIENSPIEVLTGDCGTGLTWTYDEATGTLTISGKGNMKDYSYSTYAIDGSFRDSNAPWSDLEIRDLVLEEGITSIGIAAFGGCTELHSVTFPETLKSINESAFSGCTGLNELVFDITKAPDGFIRIGSSAFKGCTALTEVILPVYSFDRWAFQNCTNLTSVTILSTSCYFDDIDENYPKTFIEIFPENTVIYSYADSDAQLFSRQNGLSFVDIGEATASTPDPIIQAEKHRYKDLFTYEYDSVWDCICITEFLAEEIEIPDTIDGLPVEKINGYKGDAASNLRSITFPSTLRSISGDLLSDCPNLKELVLPASLEYFSVELKNDPTLESITVKPENSHYQSIDGVLYDAMGSTLIYYPQGKHDKTFTVPTVSTIKSGAFQNQTYLEELLLPNSLETIEDDAFFNASHLKKIRFENDILSDNLNVGAEAFEGTPYYDQIEPQDGLFITPEGILLNVEGCDTALVLPPKVRCIAGNVFIGKSMSNCVRSVAIKSPCTISSNAFHYYKGRVIFQAPVKLCGKAINDCNLTKLEFEDVTTLPDPDYAAIYNLPNLRRIVIHGNAILKGALVQKCNLNLQVIVEQDCTLWETPFKDLGKDLYLYKLRVLGEVVANGKEPEFVEKVEFIRKPLNYTIADPMCKPLTAQSHTQTLEVGSFSTVNDSYRCATFNWSRAYTDGSVNNGYRNTDKLQEVEHPDGTLYAVIQNTDGEVMITAEDGSMEPLAISNEEFDFGAAGFDDQGRLFILWGKTISQESVNADPKQENLVLIRYDMQGNETGRRGIPVEMLGTMVPFQSGNAQVGYHDGQVLCLFNTQWGFPGDHSFNGHQGMELIAVNADTMELTGSSNWEGSHSFGISSTETEYGYAAIQMGDVYDRGIMLTTYQLTPDGFQNSYVGRSLPFHSSGQYGIDGNATYTHLGGIAKSHSTYAIVGKSERFYSSAKYKDNDSLPKGNFDVFVKIIDQSLQEGAPGLAGEKRTDLETGEVVDYNIVWLTDTANHSGEKYGDVKIVTLSDGSYCVLWERWNDEAFDSVRMIILDECGNILQGETEIKNARLSNTSIMPIVQGNTLHWAVVDSQYDYKSGVSSTELTWYSLMLESNASPIVSDSALLGDLDSSGTINIMDVIVLNKYLLGSKKLDDAAKANADVDKSGEINSTDSLNILKYVVGQINSFAAL